MTIVAGSTDLLIPTVLPDNATNKSVTWSSNPAAVASVDGQGLVSAHTVGTAIITVTTEDGNHAAQCTVTVVAADVPVTGVLLDIYEMAMTAGAHQLLTATVRPDNATNRGVTWSSTNINVVSVDYTGLVTAHAPGMATITVTTEDGNRTAQCMVTVIPATVSVTGVALDKNAMTLMAGDSGLLTPTVVPANATIKAVTWSSNNNNVASVDAGGMVTAHSEGMAAITVTTVDGNRTAQCIVSVIASTAPVESVSLNKTAMALVVRGHEQETLVATVLPNYAANKSVIWSSNNQAVASVSNQGLVTAHFAGTAVVTVTTVEGNHAAQCIVTVTGAAATGISLNKSTTWLAVGGVEQLEASVLPANATIKAVAWSSNSPAIASVDANGLVAAHAMGTARITATAQDGGYAATCDLTVYLGPAFETHPQSQTVFEGSSAIFTSATSGSTPTYQWQISTNGGDDWQNIAGATGANHTTPALAFSDGGNQYRVIATNIVGSAISNAATATVKRVSTDWLDIKSGSTFTVALHAEGTLWAWGNNLDGQLGIGVTGGTRRTPVRVGTDSDWVAVWTGASHVMARKADGSVWGWGRNYDGRVGVGNFTGQHNAPIQLNIPVGNWTVYLSGGMPYGMGTNSQHSMFIQPDGSLWACGYNYYGQLGQTGIYATSELPRPTQVGTATNWKAVSPGGTFSVGIRTDGSLWTWGDAKYLGIDTITVHAHTSNPFRVGTENDWAAVSASSGHTFALKNDGSLWAWGVYRDGYFGSGSAPADLQRTPVQFGTDTDWKIVSAGTRHTVAIKADGSIWAWGSNSSGQLGDGTTTDRIAPVQVGNDKDWVSVRTTGSHTVAMKSDGSIWAWGYNGNGELGDNTTTNRTRPQQVK
jgi:uncharacterized protein YjdB/alpha-tubulin suppressor-like RCC1 family protein